MSIRYRPSYIEYGAAPNQLRLVADAAGYQLVPDATPRKPEDTLIDYPLGIRVVSETQPLRLVRLGGDLKPYRPLDHFETLFTIFASDVETPKHVLDFAQRFGALTLEGLDKEVGEPVYDTIVHAEGMREFLGYVGSDKRLLARGIDSQMNPLGQIDVELVLDPATTRPKLRL